MNYTNELNDTCQYMQRLAKEYYPTNSINVNYFILAVLQDESSDIHHIIEKKLTTSAINRLISGFSDIAAANASRAIKPEREITYDTKLKNTFKEAEEEAKKTHSSLLSTVHVFLAILSDNSSFNKIKEVFGKAGLTYHSILLSSFVITDTPQVNEDAFIRPNEDDMASIIKDKLGIKSSSDVRFIGIDLAEPNSSSSPSLTIEMVGKPNSRISKPRGKTKTPNINAYCTNLNEMAAKGEIDPLIGRENELKVMIRTMGRRKKNSIIILGEEGVGKTALCENLAAKIIEGEVPDFLLDKIIVSMDMTALMAGTTLRGMFEERVKGILDEIKNNKEYILFIDNIGAVMADKGKNDYDISSMLSHALENGELQVIGTSDFKSYRSTFDSDPSLSRRFQKIIIDAPTIEQTIGILKGLAPFYEKYHNIKINDEVIEACVYMADKYIPERRLPDSAIDIMDEVGAMVRP